MVITLGMFLNFLADSMLLEGSRHPRVGGTKTQRVLNNRRLARRARGTSNPAVKKSKLDVRCASPL